jgi:hypothetical protein
MPTMWFWRDVDDGPGCLEYGWVADGHRHPLLLLPGEEQKSETEQIKEDQSHVQVYRLTNNNRAGLNATLGWQFPPGRPYAYPLIKASILVLEREMLIIGVAYFADRTSITSKQILQGDFLPCPDPRDTIGKP